VSNYRQQFIDFNKSFWSKVPIKIDVVLVEGRPYINQVIASSLAAKAIQELKKIPAVIWLSSQQDEDIYKSFSIERIVKKKKYILFYFYYILPNAIYAACKLIVQLAVKNNRIEYFIDFYKIDGIRLGDLIYDSYIRNDHSFLNPKIFSIKFGLTYIITIIEFFSIKHFFKTHNVKYAVVSKWQYNNSGAVIARYALFNNIKVIHTSFDKTRVLTDYNYLFHDTFKIFDLDCSDFDVNSVNKTINKRFSGVGIGFDIKSAFSEKIWSADDFSLHFGKKYDRSKKNIFIMLHAFSDANHLSGKLIYRDYYKWFKETIKIANTLPNVNWIVKQHPSLKEYYEEGIVTDFLDQNISNNIFLLPENFNTMSVFKIADAVITARGTIALEASLFGIPAVLAGESNFSNLGFTYDMKNAPQYEKFLQNIENLSRLSEGQVLLAKKAFNNYALLMGSKLDGRENSWVYNPSFYPSQSLKDKTSVEANYFKKILYLIGIDYAGQRNPYYKNILISLKLLD
jgi:hypothetical protein